MRYRLTDRTVLLSPIDCPERPEDRQLAGPPGWPDSELIGEWGVPS